jgi:hypothetical protein
LPWRVCYTQIIVAGGGALYRPAALIEIVLGTVRYDGLATTLCASDSAELVKAKR